MTRTYSVIFLPLLIWAIHFTRTSAQDTQDFVAIKDFDLEKFLNSRWYQIILADAVESESFACFIVKIDRLCWPRCPVSMVTSGNIPEPGAAKCAYTNIIKPIDNGPEGAWYYPSTYQKIYSYVVDRAKNYDWVALLVFNENGALELDILSKTPQNNEARKRGLELAKKYGLFAHEVNHDTKKCDYKALEREALKYY